ncbi:MAG: divergent polysaccharide deacetylase family protein [Hyphomicrobiaceae bacterium]|nr:divergent polysaccharide deacetylase family protein [Hyphomicrobiaceae bacterium]MCC0024378.1 divergent polysaccharide deacetylase family protein [Hyphomicrobiaceae bacterium]
MTDDLSRPLGQSKKRFALPKNLPDLRSLPFGRIMAGTGLLIIGVLVGRVLLINDPDGGRPAVTVPISSIEDSNPVAQTVADNPAPAPANDPNATPIEAAPPLPQDNPALNSSITELTARPVNDFDVYIDLLEQTKYGDIPRISPQGVTPFKAYSRPSITPASANGKPLIAIIVTGLGLDEATTVDAVDRLPENITLAFAPYGQTLDRTTNAARRQGHEILLEVPMEPFDYPQSDPGPQTLLTNQPARTNLDNLYWLMARFGGYIGIMNNLGARFSSSAADFTPVMEELGTRGLAYLDDNSSNRSLSRQLASANQVPFTRANLTLDSNPSRAAILDKLTELENIAGQQGSAVGVVNALPVSIATIISWAAGLDDKNIELVPVSALMQGNQS